MNKKNVYSVKSISIDAVISCILAVISFACQIAAVVLSYMYSGKGPKIVGLLGIAGLLMAFTGLMFSKSAWKSPDGGIIMKRVSGLNNVVLMLIAVVLYILGWV